MVLTSKMRLLTSVLAYIMAYWPPLSHKNLINKTRGISVLQINHTGIWIDAIDKRYFRYTAGPTLIQSS